MSAYKDKLRGTWFASFNCKLADNKIKRITKRGFKTKHDALEYQENYLHTHTGNMCMKFSDFVTEHYLPYSDARNKRTTNECKRKILNNHILPFFGDMSISEIDSKKIIEWQNTILNTQNEKGGHLADSYKKSIQTILGSIFNFAVKHFNLKANPIDAVDKIGLNKSREEMNFWTLEEYQKVRDVMKDDVSFYVICETLYWTGMRVGELMALTREDVNLEKRTIRINKTYLRIGKEDIITSPKTEASNRTVSIPEFLVKEIGNYIDKIYEPNPSTRLYNVSKFFIRKKLDKYTEDAGVKKIRIHDLRHSHVSLLINKGYSALAIGKRIGHAAADITYRYAHLYPSVQDNIATSLEQIADS